MGNSSASCSLCSPNSSQEAGVLVMKENGDFIKLKKRVPVKEVLGAYPGHKIIRFGSERAVLPECGELHSRWLYFLVPEELVRCNHTYEKLVHMAESKGLLISCSDRFILPAKAPSMEKEDQTAKEASTVINNGQVVVVGQLLLFDQVMSELKRSSSSWKPGLQTIPEDSAEFDHILKSLI